MCGICGFVGKRDNTALFDMMKNIHHRGPDGEGCLQEEQVSLGMRRLAITDPVTGTQPVYNENNNIVAVFNGEIYNHIQLRKTLESLGHQFRSDHSDSEVIVHLYEEYGLDFLHKLNGMFAIALWDKTQKTLYLARDRAGIKPLYFTITNGTFIFASEIKAIFKHPMVRKQPDYPSLHHYFTFKNIPAPMSAFKNIRQLNPAELLTFHEGDVRFKRWWTLPMHLNNQLDEKESSEQILALLEDSVRLRVQCDVPFGAYLSGGVDSSSIVALMHRVGVKKIKTFSLIYADSLRHKNMDRKWARKVSQIYDTDHEEYILTSQEVMEDTHDVLHAFDDPFSGVTSTFFLSKLIAKHVKVALSGDGADELFGSYLSHRVAIPLSLLEDMDKKVIGITKFGNMTPLLDSLYRRGDETQRRMGLYLYDEQGKKNIYTDKMNFLIDASNSESLIRNNYATCPYHDPLNRCLFNDFHTLLPDQVLAFVDRLSMAHSVEVRTPFLDYRLIELAFRISGNKKIKGERVKHILKNAVCDILPQGVIDRPKEGFVLPINDWILSQMRRFVFDTLSPQRLKYHGLLKSNAIQTMLDKHYQKKGNLGPQIWNLMMFQLWWEKNFL